MTRTPIYKYTLLALLTLLALSASAQHRGRRNGSFIHAYPVAGLTLSQIEGDELKGFKCPGFTAGVGAIFPLDRNEMWHFSVEATYSQRGARNVVNPDPYKLNGLTLNYVDIPIAIHFTDPYGGITVGAGVGYSRLVQQPHGEIQFKDTYFIPDTSDMTFLRNDIPFIFDVRFPLHENLQFCFRWQYSLIPIKKEWTFTGIFNGTNVETWSNDCYNSSLSFRLLYEFGGSSKSRHGKKNPYRRR